MESLVVDMLQGNFRFRIRESTIIESHSNVAWNELPFDVLREICKNLGYLSLLRARFVCKSWHSAIVTSKKWKSSKMQYFEYQEYSKKKFPLDQILSISDFKEHRWSMLFQVLQNF
jgi:hypothetical protein